MRGLCLLLVACNGGTQAIPDGGINTCPPGKDRFMDFCVFPPTKEAVRTQCGDVVEFCDKTGTTRPQLACLGGSRNHPADPRSVTLTGFVHPFSAGNSNSAVTIQVYK